jgi:hypothetical protein
VPGGKTPGPSVKMPKAYEGMRKKGMSKSQAAAISNAMYNKRQKAKHVRTKHRRHH